MSRTSRRNFLKQSGAGVAAATLPLAGTLFAGEHGATTASPLPPHRKLDLPGVHAYADQQSVFAGEAIKFYVSSPAVVQHDGKVVKVEQARQPAGQIVEQVSQVAVRGDGFRQLKQRLVLP